MLVNLEIVLACAGKFLLETVIPGAVVFVLIIGVSDLIRQKRGDS